MARPLILSQIGSNIDRHPIFIGRMHSCSRFWDYPFRFSDSIPLDHRIASNSRLSEFLACTTIAREGGLVKEHYRSDDSLGL
jgi:hypothetical protein